MAFIPHSPDDIGAMLSVIGVDDVEQLFDEIPDAVRAQSLAQIPVHLNEAALTRDMTERAARDAGQLNFIGAGAYEHHIPAAVWDIVSRGEIMTAYTPYQAEASQGGLQLIYEYQTMMASLMGMPVSNASLYDGASSLAEAVLMAVRANRKSKSKRILILGAIAPNYLKTVQSITHHQGVLVHACNVDAQDVDLSQFEGDDITAVVISQPTFLGNLQDVNKLTDWAHAHGALVIGLVNPTAMALLTPPGQWGKQGADIACGEGQPLGVPLASGGPYFGFICCQQPLMRQLPGRIVGRTQDADGRMGFCLTLQAREQHIRRSKATSNICTNQGLLVSAATIYMSLLGPEGLKRVALACHHNAQALSHACQSIAGTTILNQQPFFHEFVLQLPCAVQPVLDHLARQNIQAGFDVSRHFAPLKQGLLICSTEVHTPEDHQRLVAALSESVQQYARQPALAEA